MLKVNTKIFIVFVGIFVLLINYSNGKPNHENKSMLKYKDMHWRRINLNEKLINDSTVAENNINRFERLGYTTGYGGINGYPGSGTGISSYSPIKLDLGGVVLGTLVGIGAILIIPKLVNAFTGNYGHYARSAENELVLSDIINKIDDILSQNHIDSTNCVQRAFCSYVRSTESNVRSGSADQIDDLIHNLVQNSLVSYMLDGTAIKEALENGRNINGDKCEDIYNTCSLDATTIANIIKTLPSPTPSSTSSSQNKNSIN